MPSVIENFRRFPFDNDEEGWLAHKRKIELPVEREDLILKCKAKYYRDNIDASLDIDAALGKPSEDRKSSEGKSAERDSRSNARRESHGNQYQGRGSGSGWLKMIVDAAMVAIHAMFIVGTILCLQPVHRGLGQSGFRVAIWGSLLVHIGRLTKRLGIPRMNRSSIMSWASQAFATTEVFNILSITVLMSNKASLILVSQSILAAYHMVAILNSMCLQNGIYLKPVVQDLYKYMGCKRDTALLYMGLADIAAWLQILASCSYFGLRGMLNVWVYGNLLRGRYHNPESSKYHRQAWAWINSRIGPIIAKAPVLDRALQPARNWFSRPT